MLKKYFLASLAVGIMGCSNDAVPVKKEYIKIEEVKNVEKLLLLGIDGLRPDALEKAMTPNLDSLIKEGFYSNQAQAGLYTKSGSCWSNVLTGVWANKHGVIDNTFKGSNYENYPSVFTRLEEVRPELNTYSIVSWGPLHSKIVGDVDKSVYFFYDGGGDGLVAKEAVETLTYSNPDVLFVYFLGVDVAGHTYGFHPKVKEYISEIEEVDGQIGKILSALKNRLTYHEENWLILSTTDHGGKMEGHGGQSLEEKTIFYISSGGFTIQREINPVSTQVDIVPTIFKHLGVRIDSKWRLDGSVRGIGQ